MSSRTKNAYSSNRTVTALRFHRKQDIKLEKVPSQICVPDEVRLKIAFCGICGSDIHEFLAGPIFPPSEGVTHPITGVSLPVTMGHEFVGTIVEVGSKVSSEQLLSGTAVAVNPALDHRHYGLDLCPSCDQGRFNTCDATSTYGLSAPGGGFCEEIVVKAASCITIPPGVSLRAAALAEPLAVAHHCVSLSTFTRGQTALICGAGPIGLAILLVLRAMGASKVIITEVADTRMEQARRFGADHVINPLGTKAEDIQGNHGVDTILKIVQALPGCGVDVAFDAMGLQSTLDLCLKVTKAGGTIFNVAIHEKPLAINLNDISVREKKLLGGICYTHKDFEAVLGLLANGLEAEQMITSIVPLSEVISGGFNELVNNRQKHIKILITPDSGNL